MARGITETDVHSAADALVAAGERPTVERIRSHLGTGSPNTVVRWLDTWWKRLGGRLEARGASMNIQEAPEEVSQLASQLWSVAINHSKNAAMGVLTADREALEQARAELMREQEAFRADASALQRAAADAVHARDVAIARSEELGRLVGQLEAQLTQFGHQRKDAEARAKEAEQARLEAERRLLLAQEQYASDREIQTRHLQAVEDRAHSEIDRARQETRNLKRQLAALDRERTAADAMNLKRREEFHRELAIAHQETAAQRAKADVLEGQLLHLRDLPAALTSALERSKPKPKARRRAPAKPKGQDAS